MAAKFDPPPYAHDLEAWFSKFASCARSMPGGNPFVQMLDSDPECNPYYITFGLYWYRVPGLTLVDRGRRDALNALSQTRATIRRLGKLTDELREIAAFKFPPPLGRQLRELRVLRAPKSTVTALMQIAASCNRGTKLLAARESILKELTSDKRKRRNVYAAVVWWHMREGMGKAKVGSLLSTLVECADEAFGEDHPRPQQWEKFDLAQKRYCAQFPQDFKRRVGEAKRNREKLPPEVAAMWRRLNSDDCRSIVQGLRPIFDREVGRLRRV
jgi:hypothetical protein